MQSAWNAKSLPLSYLCIPATWRRAMQAVACAAGLMLTTPAFAQDDLVYLKENVFRIPIQVAADKAEEIQELRLYVSTDRGRNWKMVRTAKPSQNAFNFRAQSDGEYWFTLAFVDKQGKVDPPDVKTAAAGLKVVIDSTAPNIQLETIPHSDNKAGVSWKLSDSRPDLATLKIEVRAEGESNWREIRVDKMTEGRGEWSADPTTAYTVRATVKDKAGNSTVTQAEIPAMEQKVASRGNADGDYTSRRPKEDLNEAPRQLDFTDRGFDAPSAPATADNVEPAAPPRTAIPHSDVVSRVPPAPIAESPYTAVPPAPVAPNSQTANTYSPAPRVPAVAATQVPVDNRPVFDRGRPDLPANPRVDPAVQPAGARSDRGAWVNATAEKIAVASTRSSVAQAGASVPRGESPAAAPEPVKKRIPLVNTSRFAVDYQLRRVGPAGVGKVELYVTKDNGGNWQRYGEDADRTPPFEVNLTEEGRYGLKVVVTSPAGYGQQPPKSGEQPAMVVEVDTTAPEAELYQPVPDPNAITDALLISWSSRDLHLGANPVGLYFAEYPEGPWYSIKTDLPASGQYSWRVPANIPYQVYLRLMAKDMCENASVADTPKPIVVDLSHPEAEVTGIATLPDGNVNR